MSNYNPYTAAFAALTNSQARQFYAQTAREHSQLLESSLVNAMTLCLIVIRLGQLTREFIEWQKREEPSPRLLPSKNRNLQNLNGKTRTVQVLSLPPAAAPIALIAGVSSDLPEGRCPAEDSPGTLPQVSSAPRRVLITPAPQTESPEDLAIDNYWSSDDREEFLPSITQRQLDAAQAAKTGGIFPPFVAEVYALGTELEASMAKTDDMLREMKTAVLDSMTIRQLKAIARDRKLAGYGRMTKAKLVEALSR
ncbi:MAG: Rho termination factor N-terminal domain-containing protein [Aphanocapsa sp. GSE-SYN-MK-11-07L]|jgi:hypothetical protein|nr:Rho termination factor N-terminal domain-containing protein [Aphanocapsa sp. GSE-SYN-MK-11-07L]